MNLPEIYNCLEDELYKYCNIKSSQDYPERRFRDDFDIIEKETDEPSVHLQLNYYGGKRHLVNLHSPEKYFSIEITCGSFIYPGYKKVLYNYQMWIFNIIIDRTTHKIHRIDKIYPHREPFPIKDLKEFARNLGLLKKDLLNIYNWLSCLNISLI